MVNPAMGAMVGTIPVVVGGGVVMSFTKAAFPEQQTSRRRTARMRKSAQRRTVGLRKSAKRRTKAVKRTARRRTRRSGLGYGDFSNIF